MTRPEVSSISGQDMASQLENNLNGTTAATQAAAAKANQSAAANKLKITASVGKMTSSPTEWSSSTSLRYPTDTIEEDSDYVYFEFYNYIPPFSGDVIGGGTPGSLNSYNASVNDQNLEKASNLPGIMLYMPEGVTASYKADWTGKKFSNVAAGILRGGSKLSDGDVNGALAEAFTTIGGGAARFKDKALMDAVTALVSSTTGDSISATDIFSSVGGAILNPNAELIFGGHDLRTFRVKFLMVPYNVTEAAQVDAITRVFKKAMLPKFESSSSGFFGKDNTGAKKSGGKHGWIGLPNLVKFTFMQGSNPHPYVTQFKPCAITDFDVSYTPDGVYASTYEGYPVATQIEIGFIETKLVYDEDISTSGASY